jgi:hypothetical protein
MTIKRIKTDVIYDHEKYGEVLVTGIGKMYNEWVVSSGDGPDSGETLVYFYDDYDGYGGMNPMPLSETANEFAKASTEEVREHDYIEMDYDDES